MHLGVDDAEAAEHLAARGAHREARPRPTPIPSMEGLARVRSSVVTSARTSGSPAEHVLAERLVHRVLHRSVGGQPLPAQPVGALVVDHGDEGQRCAGEPAGQGGQAVEGLPGLGVQQLGGADRGQPDDVGGGGSGLHIHVVPHDARPRAWATRLRRRLRVRPVRGRPRVRTGRCCPAAARARAARRASRRRPWSGPDARQAGGRDRAAGRGDADRRPAARRPDAGQRADRRRPRRAAPRRRAAAGAWPTSRRSTSPAS